MFSKSIRTTVEYEATQTHNWNCRRKTDRLSINKVPELNYDQDGSANTASGGRTGVLQVLPLLVPRWFIVWLPHTSMHSNICRVSSGFSFSLGSSRTCEPFSYVSMYVCLSLVFPDHHPGMGFVAPQSPGAATSQKAAVASVCCFLLRKS